jgi:hypothetical protein
MRRRLTKQDPDFRVPEAAPGLGTTDAFTDGYTVLNRARKTWGGGYRLPNPAQCDEPDYDRVMSYPRYSHDED